MRRSEFLQALATVRGNRTVNSENPEDTYDVLNKYGTELVAKARAQKIDPVIGRDEEIRHIVRILLKYSTDTSLVAVTVSAPLYWQLLYSKREVVPFSETVRL